ncbi:glycerol kinase GlpK [Castellaniella sp.]|uniref:glycerol kinase GlpK n=1 Tax=Castellaniella sp. TaxID=1955812 RepID=UPI002AFF945A|nr:glycerol kinase GlpK [Castellaniella sp.]
MTYLLALDQGTSSTRSIVFDRQGRIVGLAQREFTQHYPQPGWVEHDAMEIWRTQQDTMHEALHRAGVSARDIRAIGITNQRETTVVWDRRTGEPIHHAIVWQDRRAEPTCAELRNQGLEATILQRTGLRIDAYFSATKLKWILDQVPGARARARAGELLFGTVDSWLIWQLTGGRCHLTDVSNAARTMLMDVHRNAWDADLLDRLDIPAAMMPQIQPSAADFGQTAPGILDQAVPICGVAGDQQSALFGQACFRPGMAKNTYGTGCFMLMHTGEHFQVSQNGLVTTSAAQVDARPAYALEGSVFVGGAVVQWLRDGLRAFTRSSDIEEMARSVPDSAGVMFVPAFTGLGAPWWDPQARGTITGLTRGTTMAHIARAALESIAYQSAALLQAMSRDAQAAGAAELQALRVDGGACVNDLLMQFQADLLGIPVLRPTMVETTALGAAFLAGLQAGVYADLQELESLWRVERQFDPAMPRDQATERLAQWDHAIRQATAR